MKSFRGAGQRTQPLKLWLTVLVFPGARGGGAARVDRGRHDAYEPCVDRQTLAARHFLGAGLEVGGQAQIDAGGATLVRIGGDRGKGGHRYVERLGPLLVLRQYHHEVGVEAAQPYVNRAGGEFAGDLVHGGGQHIEQGQTGGRLQRRGQPLGQLAGFVTPGFGGHRQFPVECFDIRREVHDSTMAPLWRHWQAWMCE